MQERLPDGDAQQVAGNAVATDLGGIFKEVMAELVGLDGWVFEERKKREKREGQGWEEKRNLAESLYFGDGGRMSNHHEGTQWVHKQIKGVSADTQKETWTCMHNGGRELQQHSVQKLGPVAAPSMGFYGTYYKPLVSHLKHWIIKMIATTQTNDNCNML